MATGNPLSGHTAANITSGADGLRDGDHIISPSLTNLYEGVHGNGILLYEDTAYGDSDRNNPQNLPGAISVGAAVNLITVKSFDAVLDGVLYNFGGGSDITVTLTSGSGDKLSGTSTAALSNGKECLFVILATPSGVKFSQTALITTAAGAYPSISSTPATYLTAGVGSGNNRQTIVLGTMRATHTGGTEVGDLKIQTASEFNDKRVFIRPSPIYFTPVTPGAVDATTAIVDHTELVAAHTSPSGDLGKAGALWQSHGEQITSTTAGDNDKDVLYYSGTHAARFTRSVFDRVLTSTATSIDLKSTDANILVLTPGGTFAVTTSGPFPAGYVIEIKNTHASNTGTFALTNATTSAIGDTGDADGGYARFVCTVSHATDPTFVRLI